MFIIKLISALDQRHIKYALAGGYAVAIYGAVRGTIDIDLIVTIDEKNLLGLEEVLKTLGLVSKIPVSAKEMFSFREEYIRERNLITWSFVNPNNSIELVDVLIAHDLRNFKTERKKTVFGDVSVVAIPDLIRMKKMAGRPQDLADVAALEKLLDK